MAKYVIYCDGLCEPNDGSVHARASWGFAVYAPDGELVTARSGYMGEGRTNNESEYMALIEALVYCHEDDTNDYEILTDSQLAVKQLNGEWQVKSESLRSWYDNAKDLIESHVTIGWVKGSENRADELTRLAYAEATGLYPHPRVKGDYQVKFTPVSELPEAFKKHLYEPPF